MGAWDKRTHCFSQFRLTQLTCKTERPERFTEETLGKEGEMTVKKTKLFQVNAANPDHHTIDEAAALINKGELVAFPTETVYGLGADGLNESSVQRIFEAKGRPNDNPIILHVGDWRQVNELTPELPEAARALIRHFWPGPLTLILKKSDSVPLVSTGGKSTVAVRMPDHPVALALIRAAQVPLAAPSANLSGKPSPTTAEHVFEDLSGRISAILDAGPTRIGLESTVLDLTTDVPTVLRPGGVTIEELRQVIPIVRFAEKDDNLNSPGTKYRHYSPRAQVHIVNELEAAHETVAKLRAKKSNMGWIGRQAPQGVTHLLFPNDAVFYGKFYFAALRELDAQEAEHIFVEPIENVGMGVAVMDRIRRSAGYESSSSSD